MKLKQVFIFACSLFTGWSAMAQTVSWGSPVTVAPGTPYGNTFPRLSMVTGNRPLVSWGSSTKVYSAVWTGSSFTTPVTLTPTGLTPYVQTWTGPECEASGDTVFVTYGTSPINSSRVYVVRSVDGGLSFGDTVRVSTLPAGQSRFPSVAIGTGGNPYVEFMEFDGAFENAEHTVSRSLDGGNLYLSPVTVSTAAPGESCDCCPGDILINENNPVVLFRNAGSNIRTIYASSSMDGGSSYMHTTEIDMTNWILAACPSSGPSGVVIGDSLVSTWMSASKVYIGTMNIHDHQAGINKQIFPGASVRNFPKIAAKGDTIVVVCQGNIAGKPKIFMASSVTGVAGLGNYIDTITAGFAGGQSRPDIEFNHGKLHLVYSDDVNDDVQYLTGIMGGPAAVKENKKDGGTKILSATHNDASIVLTVFSPVETQAQIQVVNTSGMQAINTGLHLLQGKHQYTLPLPAAAGIYGIHLLTGHGDKQNIKLVLTH